MRVGFIGLGTMGSRMARNLQRAGHQLVVHDVRQACAQPHLADGAVRADTPGQATRQTEVVFTSLPGPPEVEAVALGSQGIIAGVRSGGAYFDLSTNSPSVARRINAAFAEKNAYMLDAPVSGGPAGAASGKLALWVSGDEAAFKRYQPLLLDIGDQPRYIGPSGAGSVAKLVHNCAGYRSNRPRRGTVSFPDTIPSCRAFIRPRRLRWRGSSPGWMYSRRAINDALMPTSPGSRHLG